jgi:hypothetical protein
VLAPAAPVRAAGAPLADADPRRIRAGWSGQTRAEAICPSTTANSAPAATSADPAGLYKRAFQQTKS